MSDNLLNDIHQNFWITANAGSGKTTQLVNYFFSLIKNNINPDQIICITYTEAGAKEMKDRIIKKCQQNQLDIKEYQLKISTIHSFCQKLLTKNNIIPQKIKILNDDKYTISRIIQQITDKIEQQESLKNNYNTIIDNLSKTETLGQFQELIRNIIENQNQFLSLFTKIANNNRTLTTKDLLNNINILALKELLPEDLQQFADYNKTIQQRHTQLQQQLLQQNDDLLLHTIKEILGPSQFDKFIKKNNNTVKTLKTWQNIVLTNNDQPREKATKHKLPLVKDIQQYYIESLRQLGIDSSLSVLHFAYFVLKEYQEIKHNLNVVTYDDLLFQAKQLLNSYTTSNNNTITGELKISYLMLDEAQDTNSISWDIIKNIIELTKCKFLVVGDQKQSIYSFQGAKVEEYERNKKVFQALSKQNNTHFIDTIKLDLSYRSTPAILSETDNFCNNLDNKQAFTDNPNEIIKHNANLKKLDKQPQGYNLPVEQAIIYEAITFDNNINESNNNDKNNQGTTDNEKYPETEKNIWLNRTHNLLLMQQTRRQQASEIADKIAKYIKTNQDDKNNKIILPENNNDDFSNSVAIIYPRGSTKGNYIFDIINELKEKYDFNIKIHPKLEKKHIYFEDILSFFKFFVLQNDNTNLACLLKSDLFQITDDILLQICTSGIDISKTNTLWKKINSQFLINYEYNKKIRTACDFLKQLLHCSSLEDIISHIKPLIITYPQYIPAFNLINACVEKYKSEYNYNIRGFIRLVNNENFNDYKVITEQSLITRDLKHNLIQNTAETHILDKPKVFVSTIHGVKGMEFDTVIIVNLETKQIASKEKFYFFKNSFWYKTSGCVLDKHDHNCEELIKELDIQKDRDKNEKKRLHYVAMTRAKRKIVYFNLLNK